jgi:F1F0 ATPase subunit 2
VSSMGLAGGALAAGMVLGTVFFGGLWWTVNRALTTSNPGVWFGLSALLRMAVAVYGLYCFARLGLPSLTACFCGLLIARGAVKRLTRVAG